MIDPITGRDISKECWNGKHYDPKTMVGTRGLCNGGKCECFCHPNNQERDYKSPRPPEGGFIVPPLCYPDPDPLLAEFEKVCGACLGTREVPTSSTNYIPCPRCCRQKEETP